MKDFLAGRATGARGFFGSLAISLSGVVLIWSGDRIMAAFDGLWTSAAAAVISVAGMYLIRWGARLDYRADRVS